VMSSPLVSTSADESGSVKSSIGTCSTDERYRLADERVSTA
jgi:hypothetical protein